MKSVITWDKVPVIIDLPYAACLLGTNTESLRQKCKKGNVPAFQLFEGGAWRIEKEKLRQWIEQQTCSLTYKSEVDLTLPDCCKHKIDELHQIVSEHSDYIPITVAAKFLNMKVDGLRDSIEKGQVPFGICWQLNTMHGKAMGPGNRAFKIPTVTFWLWYTNNAGYMK